MSGGNLNSGVPRRHPWLLPHLLVFLLFLSLWTWKLLEAHPVPPGVVGGLSGEAKFVLAKCLHLGGYTFLTILASTMPSARRWQIVLVAFLVLHGAATEFGQTFVPNRTGKGTDVLIDWTGIAIGLILVRWWHRRRSQILQNDRSALAFCPSRDSIIPSPQDSRPGGADHADYLELPVREAPSGQG